VSKLRTYFVIAAIFCAPSLFAQGSNCSYIQNFLTSDTKIVGTSCDIHFNQTVTETQTYNVQCVDQTNNGNVYFNATSQMTSTGTSSLFCGGSDKIDCSPTFSAQNVNAAFTTETDNINRFFLRVWAREQSLGRCNQISFSQDLKQCAAVPCGLDAGAGGGCSPPPDGFNGPVPDMCDPLVVDLSGNGFDLTNVLDGVMFDIRGTGRPFRIPWTSGSGTAFLVLDRNRNGQIDSGVELFSNVSPQSPSSTPNGFLALAEYDKRENGGNGDGVIDARDAIFSQLRLWVDANHDGVSRAEELHTLTEMGVFSISLDYSLSRRTDKFGNVFRYKAKINQGVNGDSDVGKKIYDVFFVTQ
jgi:hypothetical protein